MDLRKAIRSASLGATYGSLAIAAVAMLAVWQAKADFETTTGATVAAVKTVLPPLSVVIQPCGDGTCQTTETVVTCPIDCPATMPTPTMVTPATVATATAAVPTAPVTNVNRTTTTTTTVFATCGNKICETALGENGMTCSEDCQTGEATAARCGDGFCSGAETGATCPRDCGTTKPAAVCGDGTCQTSETQAACPRDCGEPIVCGDAVCDFDHGETAVRCPLDCSSSSQVAYICGDARCDAARGETNAICPGDCQKLPMSICDNDGQCDFTAGETTTLCPKDCVVAAAICGNGSCEAAQGETELNCATDCFQPLKSTPIAAFVCGDGKCQHDLGESEANCARDCSIPTPVVTTGCVDSDGGKLPRLKGTVKSGTAVHPDVCVSKTQVREAYCEQDRALSVVMSCPDSLVCLEGACLASPRSAGTASPSAKPPVAVVSTPITAAKPSSAANNQVLLPGGAAISLPDDCARADVKTQEECRVRRASTNEAPDQSPTSAVTLPLVCTTLGITEMASCQSYLTKIVRQPESLPPTAATVMLSSDSRSQAVSERCFRLGYSTEIACTAMGSAASVLTPASATQAIASGSLPEACQARGLTKPTECASYLQTLVVPAECLAVGLTDLTACQARLAAARRPTACATAGELTDAACLPAAAASYLPPLCQKSGLTETSACRDAVFAKYGLPQACHGLATEACWRLVETGQLHDHDFTVAASKDLVSAACVSAGIVTTDQCQARAAAATLPEACLLAGHYTGKACDRFLFEQGRQAVAAATAPEVCASVGISDSLGCAAYLTINRLPADCARAGLTETEACHRFLAALDLPEACRTADLSTRDECETMLRQQAVQKQCSGLLPTAKLDAAARNAVCAEVIYRQTAAKVVCTGLTATECATTVKTDLLGSVAEANGRLDALSDLSEAASKQPVPLKEWRAAHPQEDAAVAAATVKGASAIMTALPARAAVVVTEAGTVKLAAAMVIVRDTDGDGVADDVERRHGLDPTRAATEGTTPDLATLRTRNALIGIDLAIARNQPLGQPLAEGLVDERLQVSDVSNNTVAAVSGEASAKSVTLSGRGVPGEIVTLYVYSDVPLVATATVGADGQWRYTIEDPLSDGVHEAYVAVNDDTGRVVRKSDPLTFIIQAAQAASPEAFVAATAAAQAPDVNLAATAATTTDLNMYLIGGVMLLLAAGLIIAVIVFSRRH